MLTAAIIGGLNNLSDREGTEQFESLISPVAWYVPILVADAICTSLPLFPTKQLLPVQNLEGYVKSIGSVFQFEEISMKRLTHHTTLCAAVVRLTQLLRHLRTWHQHRLHTCAECHCYRSTHHRHDDVCHSQHCRTPRGTSLGEMEWRLHMGDHSVQAGVCSRWPRWLRSYRPNCR